MYICSVQCDIFEIYVHYEIITNIKLINMTITLHSCVCVCVLGIFKIYSLSKFKVHNMILTIVTILSLRYSQLIHSS